MNTNGRRKDDAKHLNPKLSFADSHQKGQLFIIAAVFMVAGMVLIFGVLSSPLIVEEKKFQDVRLLDKNSKNILNEYKYAAGIATLNSPANVSLLSYMLNLSDYYRRESDSRIFYAAAMLNGSTQRFSIDVGNYLKDSINITINATDSTPSSIQFVLDDKTNRAVDFLATINKMVDITLDYSSGNARTVERFSLNSSSRNVMLLFSDVSLKDGTYEIRLKDVYNRTW
jgi:hypothetical protein